MKNKNFLFLVLLIVASMFIIGSLQSCKTVAKQVKKACKTLNENPKDGAKYCSTAFPVKEKVTTKTVYKPGATVKLPGMVEYVTVDCDSAVKFKTKIVRVAVNVPVYIQVDTQSIEATIERENVAALAAKDMQYDSLGVQYRALSSEGDKVTANRNKWRKWALYEGGGIFLIIAGSVYAWSNRRKIAALRAAGKLMS